MSGQEMTLNEKLDAVLTGLASSNMKYKEFQQPHTGWFMKDVCQELQLPLAQGEEKMIQGILLTDGYIEYAHPPFLIINISSRGYDFVSKGGYKQQEVEEKYRREREALEIREKESTISMNMWNKFGIAVSILISIISLGIAIVALVKK